MEVWLELKESAIIVRKELKYNTLKPIFISLSVFFIIFIFFGFSNLSKDNSINVMEMYLPLIGIILITPVFEQEQDYGIEQTIRTRRTNFTVTLVVRIIVRILVYILITLVFAIFLKNNGSYMDYKTIIPQSIGIGFLYGSLGVFFFGITFNLIIGYLVPIIYFIANSFLGYEKLKEIFLFRLKYGLDLNYEYYFIVGVVLIVLGVLVRIRRRS